jgi:hypothetical protein
MVRAYRHQAVEEAFQASWVVQDNHKEGMRKRNLGQPPAPLNLLHMTVVASEGAQEAQYEENAVGVGVEGVGIDAYIACRCMAI